MPEATSNNTITPTRRGFLSRAAGVAAGGTVLALATIPPAVAAAAPVGPSDASPELRDAARALDEAHERLKAAKARFNADDLKVHQWRMTNPEPLSKRGRKRWARKWREYQDATEGQSWRAQLEAERDFQGAQMAVARISPRDMRELALKASLSSVYDCVPQATYLSGTAPIGFSVAIDLVGLMNPVAS
ncbi:hypothetical protein ACFFWD_03735 [Bradyrhizobium erythrophlei]|uniref:hypothetical protein n=1 Tax=Bradyrhizobium erythrophlei TaxID=1437360 RepID=UPI0035E5DCDF